MAGNFNLFSELFDTIDGHMDSAVNGMISQTTATIAPVATVGLVLAFMALGIAVILGKVEMPASEFLSKSLRSAIIAGIALGGGFYQGELASRIREMPEAITSAVIPSAAGESSRTILDKAGEEGLSRAGEAWEQAGIMSGEGLMFAMAGIIMFVATIVMVVIGGAFMILSKVLLSLAVGLGPIFIVMLLFEATSKYFELWVGACVSAIMLTVLMSAVFALLCGVFDSYASQMAMDGNQNMALSLGGLAVITGVSGIVLLSIPALADRLSNGLGISGLYTKANRTGAGTARGASAAGSAAYSAGSAVAQGVGNLLGRGGGGAAAGAAGGAEKAVQGHARGKKAA